MPSSKLKGPLLGGALAAVGASLCCVGPLVLVMLGIGGAWIANLSALEPLRPLLIGATLIFLGLAFRRLYLVPQACTPGTPCADPATLARQRAVFWVVTLLLAVLLAIPAVLPYFF